MIMEEQDIDTLQKCEFCERKMNPTVRIYKEHNRLCSICFANVENMPEIVLKSVERVLVGNVV